MEFGEHRKKFSIGQIFLSIGAIVALYSLFLSIGFLFAIENNRDFIYGVLGLSQFAFMGGLAYYFSRFVPIEKTIIFRIKSPLGSYETILWSSVGFVGLYMFTSGLIPIQNFVLPDFISNYFREFYSDYLERFKTIFGERSNYNIFFSILSIAVAPAIFEELAFRGFFLKSLEQHLSENKSIIIVSFAFALIHFSLETFLPLFVASILIGRITIKTNSIYPSMLIHFLLNSSSVIAFYFASDLIEKTAILTAPTFVEILLYFGMCFGGIAIMWLSYSKIANKVDKLTS